MLDTAGAAMLRGVSFRAAFFLGKRHVGGICVAQQGHVVTWGSHWFVIIEVTGRVSLEARFLGRRAPVEMTRVEN